ncbi:transposon Tf2-9 polyprotein [Trichonephila clavipes]|nr:transposon Tf2-9 polyprotein [Trichonephila clavipes]
MEAKLENYLLAIQKDDRTDKVKIAFLLNLLGFEGLEIYNTFKLEWKAKFLEVLQKFEEYCSPQQNAVYERYNFFSCVQLEGQTIETCVTQLKTLASTCEFAEQENGLIRDRIVLSTKNIHERNVPQNELVYIDSVNENETKCAMENSTDSNFKNVEMVSETTWYKNVSLDVNNKSFDANFKLDTGAELIKQYKDVFTGVGEFPNEPYHITLKDNAVSEIHPPRPVTLALQPKLKSTLDRLEKEDPRDLNKVIKREHYQIPCSDDIISKLEGKKIFSIVDLKDGFWHVPLDEVSSEICIFNTPFGRYKFNKMPLGIVSAPEIEKELLAIVFSFEKYHNFVYGRKVVVQSDHKPIMAIVKKPMHKISSRNQRMILKLFKYDFEINYVPGNQMFLADTLSRAFPVSETVRDDPGMLNIVHTIPKHLPMSEKRRVQFKKETEFRSRITNSC